MDVDALAELKVKTVCGICNNRWMSVLKKENIPIIGEMVEDRPTI